MIPPANMLEEDNIEKEKENEQEHDLPQSPASTVSQQESKLQKLKRSLSFKAKSLRSKSADNFFQRTNSDMKLQVDLLTGVSTSTGQLTTSDSHISSPTKSLKQPDTTVHSFLEHIFKKPTFCDVCNHMIVGTNAKHGLRCKACKMSIHHKCADGVGQQRCMGKLPKGFRRYYSSPLLIQEQFGCIKEVMPIACGSKVDPVYETLRFGTSLAQKTKRSSTGSGSESPHRNSTTDLAEVPEESDGHSLPGHTGHTRKLSDSGQISRSFFPIRGCENITLPTAFHQRGGRHREREEEQYNMRKLSKAQSANGTNCVCIYHLVFLIKQRKQLSLSS
nr:PREDICTED: SH3 and cysteine-rich domain-containing protein isoform X3 [Lepisosteus oculatus]